MKSVIEEIYLNKKDGNYAEETENYWKIHKEVEDKVELLKTLLPQAQKEQIEKLYSLMCALGKEQGKSAYKQGFKEGVLLAVETFNN